MSLASDNIFKMHFTNFVLMAVSAIFVAATPIAEPGVPEFYNGEKLVARQIWCTACKNGGQTCCSAVQCGQYSC
ncbi:uncharacterized protein B0I36DRAFT_361231 [Microdochium trichocladiopsis]|uniref:Uncharacterized protein n=1 Tax=Microdochium trichocladiopsis TaxID=1682393 RepID=A0A9P8YDA2_9PEZI|nr:uncharacterized protein B0I36DRAFT_361231 [Microdochium trichocladiopsis]KAH7035919.1 hypothetical protein B0I36DRAFT_361231 [Microdochium trichocladiopsis]